MPVTLRIALRDWDYMTPLVLGDVSSSRLDIKVDRVGTLVSSLADDAAHDAAEMSFSRYSQMRHDGDDGFWACRTSSCAAFAIAASSPPRTARSASCSDLAGKTHRRDGLARFRKYLDPCGFAPGRRRRRGCHVVCRAPDGSPSDRRPARWFWTAWPHRGGSRRASDDRSAAGGRARCRVHAFHAEGFLRSGIRRSARCCDDFRAAEVTYFQDVGYVPGMHLIGFKADIVQEHPWLMDELSELIDESQRSVAGKAREICRHHALDDRRTAPLRGRPAAELERQRACREPRQ